MTGYRNALAVLGVCVFALARDADAQQGTKPQAPPATQTPPERPPDTDYAPAEPTPEARKPTRRPATAYAMPDVPDAWNNATTYDGRAFSARLSLVPIVDFTAFSQDEESIAQVGEQESQWDLRTGRIMTRGRLKFAHPVDYFVSVEVKGRDHRTGDDVSAMGFTDWSFSTAVGRVGVLSFGKIKEPFIYEIVGDAANLQQQERVLSPGHAPTRNIGFKLANTIAGGRMTWAAGWFNDWWIVDDESFDESANFFTGRVTGLPHWANDGSDYVHLGVSMRYQGANKGTVRFRARPESSISSYYTDTGSLPADHANDVNVETLWGRGPFMVSSDFTQSWVDAPDSGNPYLWSAYVTVSYVLTGEHRPYDTKVAYARRVLPEGRWGAWEIVGRYSHVDFDDRLVSGGTFDKGTVGLNWWATRRWRLGFDYGLTGLDRAGLYGRTHSLHTRIQWVY